MNHPIEPPRPARVLIGIAAVMAILLSGVTLGVLSDEETMMPVSGDAPAAPVASQEQEDGYARPIMQLHLDGANGREASHGAAERCPQAGPDGRRDADAAGQCDPQPMRIDRQKLLVLLALWKLKS